MKYVDRCRKKIICKQCGRLHAKFDTDGTIHIRPLKGPEVIITGTDFRAAFICEPVSHIKKDGDTYTPVKCGQVTMFHSDRIFG